MGKDNCTDFRTIANNIADLHERKNADYGNAFTDSFNEFGLISPAIRLNDKVSRLKNFVKKGSQRVLDEKIEDTLMDIAAYAIMTLVELNRNKEIL